MAGVGKSEGKAGTVMGTIGHSEEIRGGGTGESPFSFALALAVARKSRSYLREARVVTMPTLCFFYFAVMGYVRLWISGEVCRTLPRHNFRYLKNKEPNNLDNN